MAIPNKTKTKTGAKSKKKTKNIPVRSHYVYENKGNARQNAREKADIFGNMTRFLQKIAGWAMLHELRLRGLFETEIFGNHSVVAPPP